MELITKEIEKLFEKYPIGSQEELGGKAKIIAKFFNPVGVGTWFITEGNKLENGDYEMFGYAHLGDNDMAEFGYIHLSELKELKLPFGMTIERDLYLPENCDLVQAMKRSGITPPDFILKDYENGGKEEMSDVVEKIKKEYKEFIEECKGKGIDYIIENAEEISKKKFIVDTFVNDYYGEKAVVDLKENEEKAILNTPNVLNSLYKNYNTHEKEQNELHIDSRPECVDKAVVILEQNYREKSKDEVKLEK